MYHFLVSQRLKISAGKCCLYFCQYRYGNLLRRFGADVQANRAVYHRELLFRDDHTFFF